MRFDGKIWLEHHSALYSVYCTLCIILAIFVLYLIADIYLIEFFHNIWYVLFLTVHHCVCIYNSNNLYWLVLYKHLVNMLQLNAYT